jgi:hypothetical protein
MSKTMITYSYNYRSSSAFQQQLVTSQDHYYNIDNYKTMILEVDDMLYDSLVKDFVIIYV